MADLPDDTPPERAGFVMLPVPLLTRDDLTDCDIRVLLTLDLLGWREGRRDGVVTATNEEIARRIGKKTNTVRDSIRRLKLLSPPLVERGFFAGGGRESLRVLYERSGIGVGFPAPNHNVPDISVGFSTGGVGFPTGGVSDFRQGGVGFPTPHPIESIKRDLVAADSGGVGFPTPMEDRESDRLTLGRLIDWLPCVTDDAGDLRRLRKRVPLWVERIVDRCPRHAASAPDWVQDALIKASEKNDIIDYAEKLLTVWVGAGGRPDFELAPRPKAVPDETDAVAAPVAPRPAAFPARQTKAEKNAEITAARRASAARHFAPKEAADGSR